MDSKRSISGNSVESFYVPEIKKVFNRVTRKLSREMDPLFLLETCWIY